MAIILQIEPAAELLAATIDSGSLEYVVDITVNTGSTTRPSVDAVLEVDYNVNGTTINTEQYNVSTYSYLGGNIHQYRFVFDAQENVQAYFDSNNDPLLDLFRGMEFSAANAVYYAELQLEFYAWLPNVNNLLELQPGSEVSNPRNVINAVIHHEDTQNLNEYDNSVLLADANWLTDKPQSLRLVCRNADEQLAGWNMGLGGDIVGMTFTGYNAAGAPISIGARNNIPALQTGVTVFPVGPQNIINTAGWTLTPAILPDDPAMKSYRVKISSANKSIEWKYYLKDSCCSGYRLYFKNRFGFYDTFDVDGVNIKTYNTESTKYQGQRGTEYTPISRGQNKILTIGRASWDAVVIKMTEEEAEWAKQLLLSNMVYMQTQDYDGSGGMFLRPVVIRDGDFNLINNIDTPVEFSFKIDAANTDKSQRN